MNQQLPPLTLEHVWAFQKECDHRYIEKEMQVEGCPIRMWFQCKFCGHVPDNMILIPSHAYVGLELIDPYYAPENKRKRLDK